MDEKLIYEVYLEVAARFAKQGEFKHADDAIAIMRKVLKRERASKKIQTKEVKNESTR